MLHALGDRPAGYPSRSELLWAFLGAALRFGLDEQEIIGLCLDDTYAGKSIYEHTNENGGQSYLEKQIEKAINDTGTTDDQNKIIIRITSGSLHEAWRETERALIRANCPVYVRGGFLVQPLWRWEKSTEKNRDTLVATFAKLNLARLRDITSHHAAVFYKYDQHERRWKPVNPPKDVIETLLDVGHWGFSSVVGIVNSPTMRPDGTLLTEPGYDPATQLWYKPSADIELPPIPERPTKEEAAAALRQLQDLLVGFPFVADVDKSVAIAALMTVVLRGAFEIAPLFFILAPEAGTGKTHLVKVISTTSTGRSAAAVIGTDNIEEMDKRLSAAAFEALPILNLNNLTFDLESALLCQMITEGVIAIRPFGKNDQLVQCDCRATTVFANGNNIHVVGDLVRRTLTCAMDAGCEQPETRTFAFVLVKCIGVDKEFTAADVHKLAMAMEPGATGYPRPKYPDLLEAYSRDGRSVSAKAIGNQLMKDLKRRSGDYHVVLAKKVAGHSNRYRLIGPPLPPKGDDDPF